MLDVFLLDTILLDSLALNLQSILQKHDKNLKIKVEEVKVQSGHCSGVAFTIYARLITYFCKFVFRQNYQNTKNRLRDFNSRVLGIVFYIYL